MAKTSARKSASAPPKKVPIAKKGLSKTVQSAKPQPAKKVQAKVANTKSAKKSEPGKGTSKQQDRAEFAANGHAGSGAYLLPFTSLKKPFEFRSGAVGLTAIVAYDDLLSVLKGILECVAFDEAWYLERYPDVAGAVKKGKFSSARNHFVECGYFEGRFPFAVDVDEMWYLKENADVAAAVKEGVVESATEHYYQTGYLEGRKPRAPK
jgi:hypothetical protein